MSDEQQWYYAVDGASQGPISQTEFDTLIANGSIRPNTLVWREGMDDWLPLGQMPGTEHFRNILRHKVLTDPHIVSLRVDESLYFANARYLEETVLALVSQRPQMKNLVLACPAVNDIDASALESLEVINGRLKDLSIRLHLSEVKGPVMDRLKGTQFCDELTGQIYMSTYDAWKALVKPPYGIQS
jgi:SulP family sulfate permease